MLQVAICDDNHAIREELKQYLNDFSSKSNIEIELHEFKSGEELLGSHYQEFDLLILDIQMDGMNGLDVARKVRETNSDMTIIFFTNYIQYALEGYEVQAYRFLLKPLSYEQFSSIVGTALIDYANRKQNVFIVNSRDKNTCILIDDILYAETDRRHIMIHTMNHNIDSTMTMREVEDTLKNYLFFRCHTSYLVSLQKIKSIGLQDLELIDGTKIPVSKHRRKDLKEKLATFWGEKFL